MLHQVLQAIEEAQGPLNLADMARTLGVDQSALEGMIAYWVRKGRLEDTQAQESCRCSCSTSSCGSSTEVGACAFVGKMPRTYVLVEPIDRAAKRS